MDEIMMDSCTLFLGVKLNQPSTPYIYRLFVHLFFLLCVIILVNHQLQEYLK